MSEKTLYWSEDGQIGCALPGHAPHKGSDTWRSGRWREMRPAELAKLRETLEGPLCEACRARVEHDIEEK